MVSPIPFPSGLCNLSGEVIIRPRPFTDSASGTFHNRPNFDCKPSPQTYYTLEALFRPPEASLPRGVQLGRKASEGPESIEPGEHLQRGSQYESILSHSPSGGSRAGSADRPVRG